MDRRSLLTALAVGTIATLSGCERASRAARPTPLPTPSAGHKPIATSSQLPSHHPAADSTPPVDDARKLPPIPKPRPGHPKLLYSAGRPTKQIALTVDDGYNTECVKAYVEFAQHTGIPLTLNPNGCYQHIWNKHAQVLRPLIEADQVMIGNHTYSHLNMLAKSEKAVRADIERNEDWIERTFKITSRPYLRPPYGYRNATTDGLAGELGYTKILLWNGTFGDSAQITPAALMNQARQWMHGGTIMLGHANHTSITGLFEQIRHLIAERSLKPVTLDTMFGTSRATG